MPEKKIKKKKLSKLLFTVATTMTLVVASALSAFASDTTELVLANIVTTAMLQGALDEVIGLLPVALPVAISFMAVRKGLSWLFSVLKRA